MAQKAHPVICELLKASWFVLPTANSTKLCATSAKPRTRNIRTESKTPGGQDDDRRYREAYRIGMRLTLRRPISHH
jgi:hypothetical protein